MTDKRKQLTVALAGNPNSGKTTTFNNLTGTRQKVGNWPGVTVEKKEGRVTYEDYELKVVDLPGTYSLTTFSIEEIVARDFILDEKPDVVVDIIDASNLERSLYLATQLRELDARVLFVLNMADVARSRGTYIDADKLSDLLKVPVVFTVGNKNEGTRELLQRIVEVVECDYTPPRDRRVRYNQDFEKAIAAVRQRLLDELGDLVPHTPRWCAIKLLEDDRVVRERVAAADGTAADGLLEEVAQWRQRLADLYDEEPEIVMTEERYGYIAGVVREVVKSSAEKRMDVSRSIDLVLTNRFLGFPIFFFFVWAMFQLTFTLGAYPMAWIESGVELLAGVSASVLPDGMLQSLVVDGVIAGVGSIMVFLPNILILFFCIALFEDTGYMARAAFLMDKVMHMLGLHGKSFIPLLMGFGCNVPAIMATRTLESERDRILTILINPLMSCSARLPVYVLLAGTFFTARAGNVIFSLYLLGIVVAILVGRLFSKTILKGDAAPFVMELPPYRVPMAKSLLIHMWDRSKMFLRRMGGVILVGSIIIWVLSTFPRSPDLTAAYEQERARVRAEYSESIGAASEQRADDLRADMSAELSTMERGHKATLKERSYLGMIGRGIEPVFQPLGFDWRTSVALLTGFVAKEVVISTLGILHAVGVEEQGEARLARELEAGGMTPLSAYAFMVFVLLYVPCLATVATIKKETNSVKWMAVSVGYSTALAWVMAFVIYQGGTLLGLG
ncbi:MAG: ferrous iron transport protein B [Desulfatibacillaceae bacterium]